MQRTDYVQVRELAKDILIEYRAMTALSDELRQKLKEIEGTFRDDGFEQVKSYVNGLLKELVNAQDSFFAIASDLARYARILEAGKGNRQPQHDHSTPLCAYAATEPLSGEMADGSGLAPTRSSPRDLLVSRFKFNKDSDGNLIYDAPDETDRYLYKTQGSADPAFQGTCGLCSCANILRLSGVNADEAAMIAYASSAEDPCILFQKLCSTGYADPGMNGGTNSKNRKQILSYFGIESGIFPLACEKNGSIAESALSDIADFVSAGRGVILSVHADVLWHDASVGIDDYHAVVVTSVKKDSSGRLLGFYICDSAKGGTSFYSAERVKRALTGSPMNVTYSIIR